MRTAKLLPHLPTKVFMVVSPVYTKYIAKSAPFQAFSRRCASARQAEHLDYFFGHVRFVPCVGPLSSRKQRLTILSGLGKRLAGSCCKKRLKHLAKIPLANPS